MPIHTGLGVSFQTGDALVGRVRGIQDLRAQGVRGHDPGTIHQCFTNTGQIVAHIPEGNKYSLLMHCIKIKSPVKFLLNEQIVFVGGNISFLCVLSCSSEEA